MLAITTLVSWALTASLGGYMLTRWIRRGGLARQRAARDRLGPLIIGGHASQALSGVAVWAGYVAARWVPLAWTAVGLLTLAVGLGLSTVTLWTPYPPSGAAGITGPDQADPGLTGWAGRGVNAGPALGPVPGPSAASSGAAGSGGPSPPPEAITRRVTDAMLARALTDEMLLRQLIEDVVRRAPMDPARPRRRPPAVLIPVAHGIGALVTVLLAVLAAASTG
ncbi:MAG: hypothetical protein ACLP7J_12690 [Streptosporangiaceae bacterium]